VLLVLVALDLRVWIYDAEAADRGNDAYEAVRHAPPGRLLELPLLHPNVHLGSVYLWYDQVAQRERPAGYSTIAPEPAARLSLRLAGLNCGDWRSGADDLLRRLGVRYVAFHRGLTRDAGWFAWRALRRHGFGQLARDGAITTFERGRGGGASPVAEPTSRVIFCEGWDGGSPRYRHAALWAKGPVRLRLRTQKPVRVTVTVDGRRVDARRVTRPVVVRTSRPGWHLIGVDLASAANGLRVELVRPR
jgi:hypothetical protein